MPLHLWPVDGDARRRSLNAGDGAEDPLLGTAPAAPGTGSMMLVASHEADVR